MNLPHPLKKLLHRIQHQLSHGWGPQPQSRFEQHICRIGLALLFIESFRVNTFADEPHPKGIALLLDQIFGTAFETFTWLHQPLLYQTSLIIILLASALLIINRLLWLALPTIAILQIAIGTLANSQAAEPGHKYQLVALIAIGLWAYDWLSRLKAHQQRRHHPTNAPAAKPLRPNSQQWWNKASWLIIQIVIASYLVSVLSKILLSEGSWVLATGNFPIQLMKTDLADYYGTLQGPQPGNFSLQIPADASTWESFQIQARHWLLQTPYAASILLTIGLLTEAASILALRGRQWALVLGLALIGMHLSIQILMQLHFQVHLWLLLLYFIAPAHWLHQLLRPPKKTTT